MPLSVSPLIPATSLLVQYPNKWSTARPAHCPSSAENCPRGTTFTSQLWTSLANLLGITLHQRTTCNSAANEVVERFHRTFKQAMRSCFKDSIWFTQLPWVLLGLRTLPKVALDISAAEMVHGDLLVIPVEFFPSATSNDDLRCIRHVVGKFTSCRQTYKPTAKHHIPKDVHSATHVFLRNDTSKPPLMSP
ncbi:uncharacterized protein [Palaemon carinicauda]|uniref:uncharacterized protein n=1 Tax=Palaemon carinicauda TaxID=392227 RepID=UPI0035B5A9AD